MLCARGGDGTGSAGLSGGRRSIGEDAREAPRRREGKGAQAGQGEDARTAASREGSPAAGQLGSEEERLRRATDSRPSDLQNIEDAFAEHPCAVLRGPLLLLIPGTLLVSERQVLFHAPSLIGGKDLVLELPLRQVSSVEPTRVHIVNPGIRIRSGNESHVFASFGHLGGAGSRIIDQLSAPLRGWMGSSRNAVLQDIRGVWSPPRGAGGETAKGLAPTWRCACCLPLKAAEGGKHADLTDGSPLAHMMISLELPCSTKRAHRLLFSDESSFEVQAKANLNPSPSPDPDPDPDPDPNPNPDPDPGPNPNPNPNPDQVQAKELVGGTDVHVTPWRREADGASAREVRWQQSLRALPPALIYQLGLQTAASAVLQTRCYEPRPGTFISVGEVSVDVPFGDSFVSRSKWVLLPASPEPDEGRSPGSPVKDGPCQLVVSYEVVFTKHVMLAPVIESANLREARRSFTALIPLIEETASAQSGNWRNSSPF